MVTTTTTTMANQDRIEQWTEAIYFAQRDRVKIPGPSHSYGELSLHDGYEVHQYLDDRTLPEALQLLMWPIYHDFCGILINRLNQH